MTAVKTDIAARDDAYRTKFAPAAGLLATDVQRAIEEVVSSFSGAFQPLDADLTAIAALSTTAYGRSLLTLADDDALAAEISEFYQPLDADLTSWAGVTRAAGFDTFAATPSSANLRTLLTDEAGTGAAYFVGGALGTPASATLTNATGLPSILAANEATDTSCFISFFTAASGELGPKTNTNLTFNSNTGVLTSASSVLTTTDINGGTVDGAVIGASSAAAITGTLITGQRFVPNSSTIPTNGMYLPAANTLGWGINSAAEMQLDATALSPMADGGLSLGTTALGWQNLFANTGFVFNIENSNWVATHTSGILTVGTGDFRVTNNFTNAASVVTVGGAQTLTSKVLTSPTITTGITPTSNDGAALGSTTLQFSDLFLAEGGVINWDNGDATITQAGNVLTFAGLSNIDASITSLTLNGAGNVGIELGRVDANSSTPFIDFHSGATAVDYDARIIVSGGSGSDAGGTLTINAATTAVSALFSIGGIPVFANLPQNSQSTAYTTVLADAQKHILHPTADNNARTFTIAANASVAYPIGTAITFVNQINTVTIAINSDTLVLAGTGTTGSRTLAADGMATALKLTSTLWMISGTGLT
jgi:hypothetical protein